MNSKAIYHAAMFAAAMNTSNAAHELRRQAEDFAQALERGAEEVCDGV